MRQGGSRVRRSATTSVLVVHGKQMAIVRSKLRVVFAAVLTMSTLTIASAQDAHAAVPTSCEGTKVTTVYGPFGEKPSDGDDFIEGTTNRDVFAAGLGNDEFWTYGGNDKLCGNGGNDWINPATGADQVYGGPGTDHIAFDQDSAGDDVFYGGDDNDWINGGSDHDLVYGDGGNDDVGGGPGPDSIYGGAGNDNLYDKTGIDGIYGGKGYDVWYRCADGDNDYPFDIELIVDDPLC